VKEVLDLNSSIGPSFTSPSELSIKQPNLAQQKIKKERNMHELFKFYAKQHISQSITLTIEERLAESEHLSLGELNKMLTDFQMTQLEKVQISRLYKKQQIMMDRPNQGLDYTKFCQVMLSITQILNEKELIRANKQVSTLEQQLEPLYKERAKINLEQNQHPGLQNRIKLLDKDISSLNEKLYQVKQEAEFRNDKTTEHYMEDAYELLKCSEPEQQMHFAKGFIAPFNIVERGSSLERKYVPMRTQFSKQKVEVSPILPQNPDKMSPFLHKVKTQAQQVGYSSLENSQTRERGKSNGDDLTQEERLMIRRKLQEDRRRFKAS
jgi:hypothetical protein